MNRLYMSLPNVFDFKLKCNTCQTIKHTDKMCADKTKISGYRNKCKECRNKENLAKDMSQIYDKKKIWYQNNKESVLAKNQEYRELNKEKVLEIQRLYRLKNKDEHSQQKKHWYAVNRKYVIKKSLQYKQDRMKRDTCFLLAERLRNRLYSALKNGTKNGSAVSDLGCSIEELKTYLESRFQEGMNWDNWSRTGWHIDHIIPLSSFDLTNRGELLKACHYTNLQPLWAKDNLSKGSNHPGSMPL